MLVFRNQTPTRRSDPKVLVRHYSDHKDDLRSDFKGRCGYCDDTDNWALHWFEIDHFVPKKYRNKILDTTYSNLIYTCRSCNNSKREKWPTKREDLHSENNEGFIDPCNSEYDKQFKRADDGKIIPCTDLGIWMHKELKLYKSKHEVIWNIERVYPIIEEIKRLSAVSMENIHRETLERMVRVQAKFIEYIEQFFHS